MTRSSEVGFQFEPCDEDGWSKAEEAEEDFEVDSFELVDTTPPFARAVDVEFDGVDTVEVDASASLLLPEPPR